MHFGTSRRGLSMSNCTKRLSASKQYLARECLWWLRDDAVWETDSAGMAATAGTAFHETVEHFIATGHAEPIVACEVLNVDDQYTEEIINKWAIWKAWAKTQDFTGALVEKPLAYLPLEDKAIFIDSQGHRDYSKAPPGSHTATTDLIDYKDGILRVTDWKTGRHLVNPDCAQMRACCLYVARALGHTKVISRIVQIPDNQLLENEIEFDAFDLDEFAKEEFDIATRRQTIHLEEPKVSDACRYCPCKVTSCPAWKEVVVEVLPKQELQTVSNKVSLDIVDNDHAKYMSNVLTFLKSYVSVLESNLKNFATENNGINFGDETWKQTTGFRESIKWTQDTARILKEHLGEDAKKAVIQGSNKSLISRVASAEVNKKIMADLRSAGLVERAEYSKFDRVKNDK